MIRELLVSVEFWVAMVFASVIKISASPRLTIKGSIITILAAVTAALIFTAPLIDFLELSGDIYVSAIAALVALSAEHLARQIIDLDIKALIRVWRGKE